jgi:hypothetical protein
VLPFYSSLTLPDYLLHFAPFHALLAVVGFRFARFGDGRAVLLRVTPRIARFCAGFLIPPLMIAALYLAWGSLGDLIYNMVSRPMNYHDYNRPVGSTLAPFAYAATQKHGTVFLALDHLNFHLPAITAFAAVALIAAKLLRRQGPFCEPSTNALIAALLFQMMMTFQIYPRAGFDVTLMLGTLAPVVAYLGHRCYLAVGVGEAGGISLRRSTAFFLVALLPALFLGEKVNSALRAPHRFRESASSNLHVPALAGIRPNPILFPGNGLAAFSQLIRTLERTKPTDAPLLVLTNEPMIYFASKRDPIFEDHVMAFLLAGWNLLPADDPARPASESIIERLEETPDGIIIFQVFDHSTDNFKRQFPRVYEHIFENYRISDSIGHYRLMRRIRGDAGRVDDETLHVDRAHS